MTMLGNRLREHGVIIHEPITLRSGEVSQFYADIKKAFGDPELLQELAQATAENLDDKTTCLAAAGYGGLPLGVAVSQIQGIPLSMVRDTEKNHGKKSLIDGYIPTPDDVVSIVNDVYTTGSSPSHTIETIETTGAQVIGCHVILSRGDSESFHYPVSHLLHSYELL